MACEEVLSQVHAMLVTEISMRGIAEVRSVEALVDTLDKSRSLKRVGRLYIPERGRVRSLSETG